MVRTICKPRTKQITLDIPKDYIGATIEILLFPIEELDNNFILAEETPKTGFGCLKGQIWMADDFNAPLDCFGDNR
ncbi:MAG: DUF2281 domain-containing protein [Fibromonadales bacterium]|nr:DUF2281 domain-containing protein [Fibromonadales bacterium]